MVKKTITLLLALTGLLTILLMTNTLTGFVVSGQGTGKLCSPEYPCTTPQVCCPFYEQENTGVCQNQEMCEIIWEITKEQKIKDEELRNIIYLTQQMEEQDHKEREQIIQTIIGGLILILVIIVTVLHFKQHQHEAKKKKTSHA